MKRFEVLMVRNEHTFMVNAIVANLGKLGCSVVETEYNVKDISNYEESADIIIFYTDNNMADNTNALVYIKDLCIEKNKQVVAIGNRDELDEKFVPFLKRWKLERLPMTDRIILEISVYEILNVEDIPTSVSINEAVKLAKKYGTDSSSSYINGVLSNFVKSI